MRRGLWNHGWMMITVLLFVICHLSFCPASAQIGTWHNYLAYNEVQDICEADDELYVLASNDLYSYNKSDQSIITYDKVNGLSDTYITHIKWNPKAQRLLIVYQNQNIDMMEKGGGVVNLSDLYQKSMTDDKTVNSIYVNEQYAYLACGFGIVKVDMERIEISESYNLGTSITQVAISNGSIYAKQKNGQVFTAALTDNLLNPNVWHVTTLYDASIFNIDRTDYNNNLEMVKTLDPGGPKYNYFGFMRFKNGILYSCSGNYSYKGAIQILDNGEWRIYSTEGISEVSDMEHYRLTCMDVDPTSNEEHVFAGSRNGLFEFKDGKFVNYYNCNNSPIDIFDGKSVNYQMVSSTLFDKDGNLWFLNSSSPTSSLIKLSPSGEFTKFNHSEYMKYNGSGYENKSNANLTSLTFDSNGLMWFVNNNWTLPACYVYSINSDEAIAYETFINQDGTKIEGMYGVTCVAEDKDGNIWVGTDVGPFVIDKANIGKSAEDMVFTQVKVPRNDGTNYADYLLAGIHVTSIMVDNDGQKWIGTNGQGVYVISRDNMKEVHHFTTENSKLLSDIVGSIVMNTKTGEVFIGTENGLCSYMSGITGSIDTMNEDDVYAYPNPVTPDYNGLITITGLPDNADVKILSSNGVLIAEGKSSGRFFTWNGRDKNNERVASGVYMVATATSSGEKGVVCKIVIIN